MIESRIRMQHLLVTMLVCACLLGCPPSNRVTVPNVVGMTQANAASAIVAAGLAVGTVSQQSSDTVPAGMVMGQSPSGGARVAPGSTVNLTVSTGPEDAVVPLPTHSFTSDTTLPPGTYLATANVSVSGATLTLSPGVTIIFQQGRRMDVGSTGRLSAVGTEAAPIVLTGEEAIRGYWGGLRFNGSNSLINQLAYVTVEYGGGYWAANLELAGAAVMVGIENCTFRQSANFGLFMNDNTVLSACTANTFTENALGAVTATPESVGYLDDASTYAGNDVDMVRLGSGTVSTAAAWPGIDVVYRPTGTIWVSTALTLDPGVWLEFDSGVRMDVGTAGSLSAVGTEDDPIVLTGREAIRGYWGGVRFNQSNAPANRLEHVFIEYGGGYFQANLELRGTSTVNTQVAIVNCVFQESNNFGLYCDEYSVMTAFSDNVLTGNKDAAAYVAPQAVGYLEDTGTYVGNDYDVVEVRYGAVSSDAVWPAIDAAYLVTGTLTISAALAIDPGAYLMFASGQRMDVGTNGIISAVGTAANPVVFTGEEAVPGYWGGIRLNQTNNPDNRFEYCVIEYGGGYWDANLYLAGTSANPTQVVVTNCHISDSSKCGVKYTNYVSTNADIGTANTFANNATGNVCSP